MNEGLKLFLKENYAADLLKGDFSGAFPDWLDSQLCPAWEASGVKYTYRCLQPQNQDEYNAKRAMLEKFRAENSDPTAEELEKHRELIAWLKLPVNDSKPLLGIDETIRLIQGKPSK